MEICKTLPPEKKEYLDKQNYTVEQIIFSPRVDSHEIDETVETLKSMSPDNTDVIFRDRREMACALVTDAGWVLTSGLKKNRKRLLDIWEA